MLKAIRDAGFMPIAEELRFVVTGTLEKRGDECVIVLDGMTAPQEVRLVPGEGGAASLPDGEVRVRGHWRSDPSPALLVDAVEPLT